MQTQKYFFVLGRTFPLCRAEFFSILDPVDEEEYPPVVLISTEWDLDLKMIVEKSGGIVKGGRILGTEKNLSTQMMVSYLKNYASNGKINFGISSYGGKSNLQLSEIKQLLAEEGISARYFTGVNDGIPSFLVEKEKIVDLLIVKTPDEYIIAKTDAVQDYENWSFRDYQRPSVDPGRGMLPPKVARMMVNLAQVDRGLVLDPFCGTGTILMEGLMTGNKVIGSDINPEAINASQKNLEWLKTNFSETGGIFSLSVKDATHVSDDWKGNLVDAIITEPFLGPLFDQRQEIHFKGGEKTTSEKLQNIIKGLEKLYIGALKDWTKVLKPKGKVVIAFPQITFQGKEYSLKKLVDKCEKLGYTRQQGPFDYSRPQAFVKRQIFVFQKL